MKHFAVILVMLTSCVLQVKGNENTFEKILSRSYDSIRIEMIKTACAIGEVKDSAFLTKLSESGVDSALAHYHKVLPNEKFVFVLQEANKTFTGKNLNKQDSLVKSIRANMMGRLLMFNYKKESEIISRFGLHKNAIESLFNEASAYLKAKKSNTLEDFQRKYKNSRFCSLIPRTKAEKEELSRMSFIVLGLFIAFAFLFVIGYLVYALQKSKRKMATIQNQLGGQTVQQEVNTVVEVSNSLEKVDTAEEGTDVQNDMEVQIDEDNLNAFAEYCEGWSVVGASVIGNSHISMGLPCQDNCKYAYLRNGWGIAITSDGAGSAKHSEIGSRVVVERGIHYFSNVVEQKQWIEREVLPSDDEWVGIAYSTLKAIRDDLEKFAIAKQLDFKSLSATAIVVIHSPKGFLTTHVGDGRAGYLDTDNEWKSLITPHKGEEANQTIFMTSNFWSIPYYGMSGVLVPESHVITCSPKAFTLMSDGCEHTSWKCYMRNEETGMYYDPNLPHAGFFNAVVDKLSEGITSETKVLWGKFLNAGNKSFANEPDDKTLIVGVFNKAK